MHRSTPWRARLYSLLNFHFNNVPGLEGEEMPIVLELLREYQQPEPGFDVNLDYWEEAV